MSAAPQKTIPPKLAERPRRAPTQARSQETVQRVLAATSALLARGQSLEMLTTATIATESGVSVGALYRFFPDKQAIVDAIALRHMELFQQALGLRLMLSFPDTPTQFLAAIIDGFAEYLAANPDFRTVAFGAPGSGGTISRHTRNAYAANGDVSAMVRDFLTEAFGFELDTAFELRLRLAIEIGDRLLAYAFEQPDADARTRTLTESKRILAATLFPPEA